ncbi:MAG: winged helix-turn-helix transcriptional regulator [Firmicutes bacterium]|nr:winged helix-turn-helix transcriptional regulator [Bacillota bacterium]
MPVNAVFNALADPTRRKILQLLRKRDMSAGEIADNFKMAKASVSHHLSILKNAGLVSAEKQGQFVIYCLNMSVLEETLEAFFNFFKGECVDEDNPEE